MARYIDADKAVEVIVNTPSMVGSKYDFNHDVLTALVDREHEIIDLINNNVPTSEVVPALHAHWTFIGNESPLYTHKCSNCGEGKFFHSTIEMRLKNEFCSCCGAWMYGEVNDG